MTQRNYFKGNYIGCDVKTGLGLPEWESIFKAYGISCTELSPDNPFGDETISLLNDSSPRAFIVPIDPEQTYFPKISSRVQPGGSMESEPLHLMSPPLPIELSQIVVQEPVKPVWPVRKILFPASSASNLFAKTTPNITKWKVFPQK
jgi:acetolactate synthase-1/2/3 large subunit